MKVLIITSCTKEKAIKGSNQLTLADFRAGKTVVLEKEKNWAHMLTPAEDLYTGIQHVRLMKGIKAARENDTLDLSLEILSAGYGFIKPDRKILPYEATFSDLKKKKELTEWAITLDIPEQFKNIVAQPYDLGLILLGEKYLEACQLDGSVEFGGPTILFSSPTVTKSLPALQNVKVITLYNPEAKRMSCNLIGLKGELATRILQRVEKDGVNFISSIMNHELPLNLLDEPKEEVIKKKLAIINPKVNQIITLHENWKANSQSSRIRYFIPEWDDLVDPDYDFINDSHSGGAGNWHNQVYAHQMYPTPNYDGILISRVVVDNNKKRRELMEQLGVHGSLRVPIDYPIMGDCGAFGYLAMEKPPYTTADVLDYYTRYGFNLGVSVDHLIVGVNEEIAKYRYQLTIQNAEDFIKEHKKLGLIWKPIGAVQGWDPKSYASAAAQYVKMGYDYIALGGLVRTKTDEILRIVEEVSKVVPRSVDIHLFGLARLEAMQKFANLGITSVDSASHLRRAWLGANDNYWTMDGKTYAAIRIPKYDKKHLKNNPELTEEAIAKMERMCLEVIRDFDKGVSSLQGTLDALDEYDRTVMGNRKSMRKHYERTLIDKPWKNCPCEICKKDGVEVIIFRGNNRNRRRGFHNTYIFYSLLKRLLVDETFYYSKNHKVFEMSNTSKQQELLLF